MLIVDVDSEGIERRDMIESRIGTVLLIPNHDLN